VERQVPSAAPSVARHAPRPPRLPTPSWLASVPATKPAAVPSPATEPASVEAPESDLLPWVPATAAPAEAPEPWIERPRSRRRGPRYAAVGGALVVLAVAGFGFGSRVANERGSTGVTNADASGDFVAPAPSTRAEKRAASPTVADAARGESTSVASAGDAQYDAVAGIVAEPPKSDASADAPAAPSVPAPPALRAVAMSKTAMSSLDSAITRTSKLARDREPKLVPAGGALDVSALGDAGTITPPVLISAPAPRFPDAMRAHPIEGEVIVQFRVTEKGRVDVSSMQVLQSPHELFTEAVRSVLPKFRFEPAHSGALDAKPQAAWVQFRTRFTATQ
jgi:TonB family protein